VLRQNVAWFDVNQAGAITTKMSDGIDRMKEGMGDKIGILCQSLAQFICGMTIAFVHRYSIKILLYSAHTLNILSPSSWKMTLVMMAIVPFIAVTMALSIKVRHLLSVQEPS
jgi:ATP-binding cassette subfamily B (MDR/TAP) protein 1